MKKLSIFISTNFAPVTLALICLAAYAPLLPFTGFYGDEWQIVYEYFIHKGAGLASYLYYDGHPLATLSYVLSFNMLGIQPFAWQLYSLILRLFAILGFWMVLRRVWPQKPREIWMAAVLFALYPLFYLQAQAVAYYEVWLSYIFLWLSFYFSIRSLQEPGRFWIFTLAAVFFKICQPLSSEYIWGTEMMRPFLLWFALDQASRVQVKASIRRVLSVFWPHLLISTAFVIWRVVIYQSPVKFRAEPRLIDELVKAPWATFQNFAKHLIPDIVLILFTGWQKVFQTTTFDVSILFNLLAFLIASLGAVLAWLFLLREQGNENQTLRGWTTGALLTGIATFFFGLLPIYVAGYFPSNNSEPSSGRFILGSLPGIALLIVLMIVFFIPEKKRQALFFALLTGLMLAWQLQAGNEFRRQWAAQADFYRELLWRAPSLSRDTAVLVGPDALPVLRGSAFTLNMVYEQAPTSQGQLAYWIFDAGNSAIRENSPASANGVELQDGRYSTVFSGNSQDAIAVDFHQNGSQCLWIINPDQGLYTPQGNAFGRVSDDPVKKYQIIEELYGNVKSPAWCYFFEKADLARQMGKWESIPALWDQAEKLDIKPANGPEYLPFIEAYARLNDWEKAFALTRRSNFSAPKMEPALCPLWQRLDQELPASTGKSIAIQKAHDFLVCQK